MYSCETLIDVCEYLMDTLDDITERLHEYFDGIDDVADIIDSDFFETLSKFLRIRRTGYIYLPKIARVRKNTSYRSIPP